MTIRNYSMNRLDEGVSRRDFLASGAVGLGGLAMGGALPAEAAAADAKAVRGRIKDRDKIAARLTGCYIPMPTLFHDKDLELNLKGMRRHVRFLLDGGLREGNAVLLVAGGGGEFTTLTVPERLQAAEAVIQEAGGKIGVIVGAQSTDPRETIAVAKGAAKLGAAAIQVAPPFYHTYTDGDLEDYFKSVGEAAEIGMVVYVTHWEYKLSLDLVARLIELPTAVAVKWAAPSSWDYDKGLRRLVKRTHVIDNQLEFVFSHMMGARGIDADLCNYWPEWGVKMWALLEAKKYQEAEDWISKGLRPFYDLQEDVGQYTGGEGQTAKLCMELVGLEGGRCRPPIRDIREKFREKARKMLKACGVPRCK